MTKPTRRRFLRSAVATGLLPFAGCATRKRVTRAAETGTWVNDVHSQINPTLVSRIESPHTVEELSELLDRARREGQPFSLCGGRHAGGGQQFATRQILVDMNGLRRITRFDRDRGLLEIEAGARWPRVFEYLRNAQADGATNWGIHQKQGGADELSLGGAVGANVHGRCLASPPIVSDIAELNVLLTSGEHIRCRKDGPNASDLFRHIVGGYGLFGIVTTVTLQLRPRVNLVRRVRWTPADEAIALLEAKRDDGALHGDFQYCVDETRDDFCAAGLCSWYEPTDQPVSDVRRSTPDRHAELERFRRLIGLAHQDKSAAFKVYVEQVLASDGQVDLSDEWQHGDYAADYHRAIDTTGERGSEILTELYVPRTALASFLREAAGIIRAKNANLIYGTVRLIERDDQTVLAWAKQAYACVIFNFHTRLIATEIERCGDVFRALLDAAIAVDGSYYLTYHRFARVDQAERCYPQLRSFLAAKQKNDPACLLMSDWYRHYRSLLGDA